MVCVLLCGGPGSSAATELEASSSGSEWDSFLLLRVLRSPALNIRDTQLQTSRGFVFKLEFLF